MDQQTPPPIPKYEDLSGVLELTLLQPELNAAQVLEGLELAKRYRVACAVVRPCDIDLAVRTLDGSGVNAGTIAGFPHGWQTTAAKLFDVRDLLRRGGREIELWVSTPQLRSREFQHVQTELMQVAEACTAVRAVLKVVLETEHLADDLKIIACRCCERAEVDFVTGDAGFLRRYLPEEIGLKSSSDVATLDEALSARESGYGRLSSSTPGPILDSWKAHLATLQPPVTEPRT